MAKIHVVAAVTAAGLFVTTAASSAVAQAQTQADGVKADSGGADVADIVVTAQKRSESVQKVAAAITAISGDSMTERGLSNSEQLAAQVPGLQFAEHATSTLFAIRGISLDITTGAGEPSVATHIDGVYQPRATALTIDMTDLDRVEVLRGPQETLFGDVSRRPMIRTMDQPGTL